MSIDWYCNTLFDFSKTPIKSRMMWNILIKRNEKDPQNTWNIKSENFILLDKKWVLKGFQKLVNNLFEGYSAFCDNWYGHERYTNRKTTHDRKTTAPQQQPKVAKPTLKTLNAASISA